MVNKKSKLQGLLAAFMCVAAMAWSVQAQAASTARQKPGSAKTVAAGNVAKKVAKSSVKSAPQRGGASGRAAKSAKFVGKTQVAAKVSSSKNRPSRAVARTTVRKGKAERSLAQQVQPKLVSKGRQLAQQGGRSGKSVAARSQRLDQDAFAGRYVRTASTSSARPLGRLAPMDMHATPPALPSGKTAIASSAVSASSGASFGKIYGLHHTADPLDLKSSVALVLDQDTNEVLLAKNSEAVLPIASLTKLMTALVVIDARLSMDEPITITQDDIDTEKNSSSRLAVGTTLTRGEALHLALMSSENRAAHALGRHFPGGLGAFVAAMNQKALQLGMRDTHYVDPTGLKSQNQSSAKDLANLVRTASQLSLIRELSTSQGYAIQMGDRQVQFRNTNSLVSNPTWDIGLQKTGYIVEAGRCLVMQARMAGRKLIMVFLDSQGKYSRLGDAERVRRWIESAGHRPEPSAALLRGKSTS